MRGKTVCRDMQTRFCIAMNNEDEDRACVCKVRASILVSVSSQLKKSTPLSHGERTWRREYNVTLRHASREDGIREQLWIRGGTRGDCVTCKRCVSFYPCTSRFIALLVSIVIRLRIFVHS